MSLPSAASAGVAQVTLGFPSMSARQHPHWPCGLQPSLSETIPHRSRSVSSSDSPGRVAASLGAPFRTNRIGMRALASGASARSA